MIDDEAAITASPTPPRPAGLDRRRRRRQETINEILVIAVEVMTEEGVAGLSLSEVARRLGIQPPSLYKYFPSKVALYDALFLRGALETLEVFRAAATKAEPGWNALVAGIEAVIRLGLDHQVVAQLLNWRPVPGFEPSSEAFAPSVEFVQDVGHQLEVAAQRGELHPAAASEEGLALLSVLIAGVLSQQLANEPHATFQQGRFTRLTARVLELFRSAYPPKEGEQRCTLRPLPTLS
jgi:AcrR family transcriptional regulator